MKLNLTPTWSNPDLRINADHRMNNWLSKNVRQVSQLVKDEVLASSLCPVLKQQFLQLNLLQICHLVPLASGLTEIPEFLETSEILDTPRWKRIFTP